MFTIFIMIVNIRMDGMAHNLHSGTKNWIRKNHAGFILQPEVFRCQYSGYTYGTYDTIDTNYCCVEYKASVIFSYFIFGTTMQIIHQYHPSFHIMSHCRTRATG